MLARGNILATGTARHRKARQAERDNRSQRLRRSARRSVDTAPLTRTARSPARSPRRAVFAVPRSSSRRASTRASSRSRFAVAASSSRERSAFPLLPLSWRQSSQRQRSVAEALKSSKSDRFAVGSESPSREDRAGDVFRGWGATLTLPEIARAARSSRHATLQHPRDRIEGTLLPRGGADSRRRQRPAVRGEIPPHPRRRAARRERLIVKHA